MWDCLYMSTYGTQYDIRGFEKTASEKSLFQPTAPKICQWSRTYMNLLTSSVLKYNHLHIIFIHIDISCLHKTNTTSPPPAKNHAHRTSIN